MVIGLAIIKLLIKNGSYMMIDQAIEKSINIVGSQKKLASYVGVSQPSVWCWLHRKKRVSPELVLKIVDATNGEVQAYQIRPDLPDLFPPPVPTPNIFAGPTLPN